jgi:hypothetical protein
MPLMPYQEPVAVVAAAVRAGRARPHHPDGTVPEPVRRSTAPAAEAETEAEAEAETIDLATVLAARTAVRTFSPRRPEAQRLARVTALALDHDASQWPTAEHGPPPGLMLAAYDVAGLDPGLHSWSTQTAEFLPAGRPPWLPDLQERYSAAPAIFLIHDSLLSQGADAYGGLLVRAGSLGYGLWLAARTHGLDACAFGGASPEVTTYLRRDASADRHLFTLVVGHAPAC